MRLILATDDEKQYGDVWELLESNGIPVHEPSKYSDVAGFRVGARVRSLYIWLDHQYDDAIGLLKDPANYVVKSPVDWEEFKQAQALVAEEAESVIDKGHEIAMNILVVFGAIGLLAMGAYLVLIK